MDRTIRYIELFAGIGGFRYGIERVNDLIHQTNSNPKLIHKFICVYANEFDKYTNSVYRHHFSDCDLQDIRIVPTSDIPDHELLVGGFPCQAFSIAGKRRGFCDTRGTLFFEIARVLRQKQPHLLLLENVKGLLSHDQGETFATILSTLDELGYDCQWQVLNSKNFGVPQQRERVFIVGHRRGTSRPHVFPFTSQTTTILKPVGGILTKTQRPPKSGRFHFSQGCSVYGVWGISPALTTDERMLIAVPQQRKMIRDGQTPVIPTNQIRNLTPLEWERLQGFPDHWTRIGNDDKAISKTRRYMMLGNAVTTTVVTAIVSRLAGVNN